MMSRLTLASSIGNDTIISIHYFQYLILLNAILKIFVPETRNHF